ncbi:hypothetical protein N7474_006989 [Penicillium riverlandense]|uniref:uncharacterized protein n=1 Tax=Penicillium riverlandense TaxID=1903569 RepID=UPI0025472BAC|nr:uncharacterized protein N7474_006989 [Penicillium riverlandense]KAJ5815212.1 hypothetical protein N7474_006989 [Penicillium riverlandense]
MSVPTLRQLATASAIRNVRLLRDLGDLPYSLVRPILLKVDNPEQLHCIEQQSPQVANDTEELWLEFIKRDIPQWETYDLPQHSDHWYELYCDLREQAQRAVDEDAEKMKLALDGLNSQKARLTPKIVSERSRLPGKRPTQRQRYAAYDRKMGGLAPVFGKPTGASEWSFQAPSLPRSEFGSGTKKKQTIFTPQKRNVALAVPTKHLHTRASQIKQAPRSLIEEHRRPSEQVVKCKDKTAPSASASGRSSGPPIAAAGTSSPAKGSSLAEKEARLRTLTSGMPASSLSSKPPISGKKASPPSSKAMSPPLLNTNRKRPATSPPPQTSPIPSDSSNITTTAATTEAPSTSPARPPMTLRRAPPSIFIQPKRKRVT